LQWAHQHGLPIAPDASTITSAVRGPSAHFRAVKDKLDIVEWLREDVGCDWDEDTFYMAARKGHEDILEYLRENECPWAASAQFVSKKWMERKIYSHSGKQKNRKRRISRGFTGNSPFKITF
jgi:hypothetical protein